MWFSAHGPGNISWFQLGSPDEFLNFIETDLIKSFNSTDKINLVLSSTSITSLVKNRLMEIGQINLVEIQCKSIDLNPSEEIWVDIVMLSPYWALPIDGAALFSWSLPPPLESAAVGPRYRRLIIMAGRDRRLRDGFAVGGILFVCVCECCCCCCPVCCVAALSPACVPVCCRVYREYTALSSYRPVFPRSVSRRIVTFGGSSGKFPR